MKKITFGAFILISFVSNAQFNLESIKSKAKEVTNRTVKVPLTNDEIVHGLKEALSVGVEKAGAKASKVGGFNNSELVRIPFPEEAKKMEEKLRLIGMGAQVDNFETALNRAAEKAAKEIIKGVQKNKRRIMIGVDAKIADIIVRLFPGTYENIMGLEKRIKKLS